MSEFGITVWGARGSFPVTGPATRRHGGHTSCVELRVAGRCVILDAGTGIEPLGQALMQRGAGPVDLFLSHAHYDHIIGLPFFAPLHAPGGAVTLHYRGNADCPDGPTLLNRLIAAPFLPFAPSDFRGRLTHEALPERAQITLAPGCTLSTHPVRHPGGSLAIKVTLGARSFVYVPDFEHDDGAQDTDLVAFLVGADLAFLDCTYTPQEYPGMRGMGHSHWSRVAEIATAAGVRRWGAFHHAHTRSDDALDALGRDIARDSASGFVVAEGMQFDLGAPKAG